MNRLGTEEVLEGVVGAVREMGFESANISIIDETAATYRVIHAHGMPADYVDSVHPATIGMTGRRARAATVAAADGTQATAVPRLAPWPPACDRRRSASQAALGRSWPSSCSPRTPVSRSRTPRASRSSSAAARRSATRPSTTR